MSIEEIMRKVESLLTGEQFEDAETKRLLIEIETMVYDYGRDKFDDGWSRGYADR